MGKGGPLGGAFGEGGWLGVGVGVVTCIGTVFWVKDGASGMGSLPIELIRGKKSLQETKKELSHDLANIREKYRTIQQKYARSHVKISKQD